MTPWPPPSLGRAPRPSRRQVLLGGAALGVTGLLAGCGDGRATAGPQRVMPDSAAVVQGEARHRSATARVRHATLTPRAGQVDLGSRQVSTWSFDGAVPGKLLRAEAGEVLHVRVDNQLSVPTTVHWHGLALRNDMDGVPNLTQPSIPAGTAVDYEFALRAPGTYWYHSHVGLQRDRGLYGPLIVDDPHDPGGYDVEYVVLLDDWIDGVAASPEQVLTSLQQGGSQARFQTPVLAGRVGAPAGPSPAPPGTDPMSLSPGLGDQIEYPFYLLNGRMPTAPETFTARPGQRARIRLINASAATVFRVAVGAHRLTVTHTDGYPVVPVEVDALRLASGERYDVTVTLKDGVFPLCAVAEGRGAQALGLIRTGSGQAPPATVQPRELSGRLLEAHQMQADAGVLLDRRPPDVTRNVYLTGDMMAYQWHIDGNGYDMARPFHGIDPLPVRSGDRVRYVLVNQTPMYHPIHLHGHTFQLSATGSIGQAPDTPLPEGARKDTVMVAPNQKLAIDFDADNPGQWLAHCHNAYHLATGMATIVSYLQ